MMETKNLGPWQIECDPELTRSLYAANAVESTTPCTCSACRNFRALGSGAFPPSARAMLLDLGIDPAVPAEIYENGPNQAGSLSCAGFFHFVGRVLIDDREAIATSEAGVRYFIRRDSELVPQAFANHPVLQFEFEVLLPWVLPEALLQ